MDPLLVTNYLYISLFSSLSLGDWLNSSLPILLFGDNFYLDLLRVLISIDLFICQGYHYRSSHQRCSMKKGVLRNLAKFTGRHLCQSLFFNKVAGLRPQACNFIKKETLAQVFSCKFCEICENIFAEHL